jgi:hypothetical protein
MTEPDAFVMLFWMLSTSLLDCTTLVLVSSAAAATVVIVEFISSMDEATALICALAVDNEPDDWVIPAENSSVAVLTDEVCSLSPLLFAAICELIERSFSAKARIFTIVWVRTIMF